MSLKSEEGSSRGNPWLMLAVLILAYVLAFVDRQLLSLLVEPLKRDLGLSDTQLGLLQGTVFAAFLAIAGVPLGQLIDCASRTKCVAVGVAAWSVMTASTALASSYAGLVLCRGGVAIGEATLTPSAHSIIADIFPVRRLGLALGLFGIGSYIGSGLALLIGAVVIAHLPHLPQQSIATLPWLGAMRPWQLVFVVVGLPGLLLSAAIAVLKEPLRLGDYHPEGRLALTLSYFRTHGRSIIWINLSAAFCAMAVYATNAWIPSFFIRSFHWTATRAGVSYGAVVIACGVIGVVAGGALGDFTVSRKIACGRPLIMMCAALLAIPFAAAAPIVHSALLSLALLVPLNLLTTLTLGILPSAQQAITASRMRGSTAAVGVLMVNVIGLGMGPAGVGLITDRLLKSPDRLGQSLAILLPSALTISALCGARSLRHYRRSVAEAIGAHPPMRISVAAGRESARAV